MIRPLTIDDLDFLLRAQKAASFELDALSDDAVATALRCGLFGGLVLELKDRRMLVSWQKDGKNALLTCLFREGTPRGFLTDCRLLLQETEAILKSKGVDHIFAGVGMKNPRCDRLMKLYYRLGFKVDLYRLGKVV